MKTHQPAPEQITCYRPKNHQGDCGEPISDREDEDRILNGRCGAEPPYGVLHAGATRGRQP